MTKMILAVISAGILAMIFSGCAGDNYDQGYNSYDNRSNYDRKMDYVVEDAAYDASRSLSAQDIKNINNLK